MTTIDGTTPFGDTPSDPLPDMPGEINGRYVLIATCRRTVPFDVDLTPADPGPAWVWTDEPGIEPS